MVPCVYVSWWTKQLWKFWGSAPKKSSNPISKIRAARIRSWIISFHNQWIFNHWHVGNEWKCYLQYDKSVFQSTSGWWIDRKALDRINIGPSDWLRPVRLPVHAGQQLFFLQCLDLLTFTADFSTCLKPHVCFTCFDKLLDCERQKKTRRNKKCLMSK